MLQFYGGNENAFGLFFSPYISRENGEIWRMQW